MSGFRLRPKAVKDIEAIGDYIATDNPARAISFIDELMGVCARLSAHPKAFRRRDDLASGLRQAVHGQYLILFTARDKDVVGMLRLVLPKFDRVIFTRYRNNPRGVPPEELEAMARQMSPTPSAVAADPLAALDAMAHAAGYYDHSDMPDHLRAGCLHVAEIRA